MAPLSVSARGAARSVCARRNHWPRRVATFAYKQAAQYALPERNVGHLTSHDPAKSIPRPACNECDEFWRKIPWWEDVSRDDFISYRWSVRCLHLSSSDLGAGF